jgi:putative ABC transport system permease protein
MLLDLKAACRELLKNRWFTCVTVLTLALGIGANTAIFGVVNRLLLNPLPYPDSDRLFYPRIALTRAEFVLSPPDLIAGAWREQARSFEAMEGYSAREVLAYDENGGRVVRGMRITPGLPSFLGVAPLLGRGFTPADAEAGAPAVVMLSYETWQRDYGGQRDVIGRAITFDEAPHVVVGVMPPRWDAFVSWYRPAIWFPHAFPTPGTAQPALSLEILGRLRPGVSVDAANEELATILAQVLSEAPRPLFGPDAPVARLQGPSDRIAGNTRDALFVLLGAVGLVLLVACSNVANLLLARGASRARELSLRSALGASTWRLVRALFAECLVLALSAGVVGVGVGWLTLRILVGLRPSSLTALGEAQLDPMVLAFTFGVSVLTALLFGLAPGLQLASRKLGDALRGGASGVVRGGMGPRLRKLLVAAQMSISVVLLVSAGLLIRSFVHLQNVDIGFDADKLFSSQLSMPRAKYQTPTSRDILAEQLLERIRSSPGVTAATRVLFAPPNVMTTVGPGFEIRGVTLSEADAQGSRIMNMIPADYFSALRIPLIEGRTFTVDEMRTRSAAIINRAAAEHFWPDGNALGDEIKFGQSWTTVVGVVENVVAGSLTRGRDMPQFYQPLPAEGMSFGGPSLVFVVRAADDPAIAIAAFRAAVQALDPEIAIANVLLTETALANTIDAPRFNMALLTAFAIIALVLAAVGLAAVIGYEVTERTHEIGIRMALGARAQNVRRLAMRHGLTPALVGVVLGLIGAFAATRLAASMLYGITPRDPLTFGGVVALLVLVALGASWVPARRATRVDPMIALRSE